MFICVLESLFHLERTHFGCFKKFIQDYETLQIYMTLQISGTCSLGLLLT